MAEKKSKVIQFKATVYKVQTLVDNGLRLTLDLSEKELDTEKSMMECKTRGALLEIAAVPVKVEIKEPVKNEPAKRRTERYPYRTH